MYNLQLLEFVISVCIIFYKSQVQNEALKPISNNIGGIGTTAKSAVHKVRRLNSQLSALADEAKKSGGFEQAFGPLGDILDVGDGQKISQKENRVSPETHLDKSSSHLLKSTARF
jgi:hypothetical protein